MVSRRAAVLVVGIALILCAQFAAFLIFPTRAPAYSGIQQATSSTPDFSIWLSTYSTYIPQGGGASVTAFVNSIAGFSAPVSLTTSWEGTSPQNVQLSLPAQVTPPAGSTANFLLTITSNPQTPLGTYTLDINAQSGSLQHQTKLTFLVAQSTGSKVQPILGYAWPTATIPVSIQPQQTNATQSVLLAMSTWNTAQQWFIQTYGTSGTPFTFQQTTQPLGPSDNGITVSFNQTQTNLSRLAASSCAESYTNATFTVIHCNISLDLTFSTGQALNQGQLQSLAMQSLGFALGLGSTTFSEYDLMNQQSPGHEVTLPSTLNLYALSLLSQAKSSSNLPVSPIFLPNNIPYATVSVTVSQSSSMSMTLTVITDKSSYACGATASVVAVLTGGTPGQPVSFEVHDPMGTVFASGSSATNPTGMAYFTFALPASCQSGAYALIASSQGATASATFSAFSQSQSIQLTLTSSSIATSSPTSSSSSTSLATPAVPGFPWEAIIAGIILGMTALAILRRRKE